LPTDPVECLAKDITVWTYSDLAGLFFTLSLESQVVRPTLQA